MSGSSSMLPSFMTALRLFSLVSVLSVGSLAGLLYTYQGKLIYPSGLPAGARTDKTTPSIYSLPFQQLWLKTPDGHTLQAWFIRPDEGEPRRNVTIVMFQANAGNIAHRLPIASILYKKLGANIFMVSYRGYGLSTGSPNEAGLKIDGQVALDWVKENVYSSASSEKGQPAIVLYGQSLGGAVAIDAAVRNAGWISGLILENTFLDIPSLVPSVLPPAKYFTFLCREIWSSRTRLALLNKRVKVLFLSGRKDELVPPSHMTALWNICKHQEDKDKEWVEFKDGMHNDTCMKPGYFPSIASFLDRHFSHSTSLSREALSRGYDGLRRSPPPRLPGDGHAHTHSHVQSQPQSSSGDSIADELAADEYIQEEGEDEEESEWEQVPSHSTGLEASRARDELRRRGNQSEKGEVSGAASLGPGGVAREKVDELGDQSARAAKKAQGKL